MKNDTTQLRNYQGQLEKYQRRLEVTNARIKTLSITDDLTGLHNGFAFEEELRNEVHRAWASDSPPGATECWAGAVACLWSMRS